MVFLYSLSWSLLLAFQGSLGLGLNWLLVALRAWGMSLSGPLLPHIGQTSGFPWVIPKPRCFSLASGCPFLSSVSDISQMAGPMLGCSGEFRQGDRAINRKVKGVLPCKGRVSRGLAGSG